MPLAASVEPDHERLRELWSTPMNIAQIAASLGVFETEVTTTALKLGLKGRSRRRNPRSHLEPEEPSLAIIHQRAAEARERWDPEFLRQRGLAPSSASPAGSAG